MRANRDFGTVRPHNLNGDFGPISMRFRRIPYGAASRQCDCSDDITKLANQMNEARREELEELTNEILGPGCTPLLCHRHATGDLFVVLVVIVGIVCAVYERQFGADTSKRATSERAASERAASERAGGGGGGGGGGIAPRAQSTQMEQVSFRHKSYYDVPEAHPEWYQRVAPAGSPIHANGYALAARRPPAPARRSALLAFVRAAALHADPNSEMRAELARESARELPADGVPVSVL